MPGERRQLRAIMREESSAPRPSRILPLVALCSVGMYAILSHSTPSVGTIADDRPWTNARIFSIDPDDVVQIQHNTSAGDVKASILAGLRWLIGHQFPEGAWDGASFTLLCGETACPGTGNPNHRVGLTALALNALIAAHPLTAGESDADLLEGAVERGLRWLRSAQDVDGCFAVGRDGRAIYGHAIAVEAMTRAYLLFGDLEYRRAAERGVRFLEIARTPGSGWGYHLRSSRCDTSITGWAAGALLTARKAHITADDGALDGALQWLRSVTDRGDASVAYDRPGRGQSFIRGANDRYDANETMTAVNVFLRSAMGLGEGVPAVQEGIRRLSRDLPIWKDDHSSTDFVYWYYGTLALGQCGAADEDLRRRWNGQATALLMGRQRKDGVGCRDGSWDAVDKWGCEGGRIYATAINVLTLYHANF